MSIYVVTRVVNGSVHLNVNVGSVIVTGRCLSKRDGKVSRWFNEPLAAGFSTDSRRRNLWICYAALYCCAHFLNCEKPIRGGCWKCSQSSLCGVDAPNSSLFIHAIYISESYNMPMVQPTWPALSVSFPYSSHHCCYKCYDCYHRYCHYCM